MKDHKRKKKKSCSDAGFVLRISAKLEQHFQNVDETQQQNDGVPTESCCATKKKHVFSTRQRMFSTLTGLFLLQRLHS